MKRRELLRRAAAAAGAVALGGRQGAAQRPAAADTSAADRLYRPDVVQQRAAATAMDNDPVVKELEQRLKCTCGCNLDIYVCRTTDFTCTYAPELHKEVVALRAGGNDPDAVVAAFVAKYGEQILMAPPPQGFNLAGYLVPGAVVALAGSILAAVLLKRGRRISAQSEAVPVRSTAPSHEPTSEDRERLSRALSRVQD